MRSGDMVIPKSLSQCIDQGLIDEDSTSGCRIDLCSIRNEDRVGIDIQRRPRRPPDASLESRPRRIVETSAWGLRNSLHALIVLYETAAITIVPREMLDPERWNHVH